MVEVMFNLGFFAQKATLTIYEGIVLCLYISVFSVRKREEIESEEGITTDLL